LGKPTPDVPSTPSATKFPAFKREKKSFSATTDSASQSLPATACIELGGVDAIFAATASRACSCVEVRGTFCVKFVRHE
jgi:DUF917 family protein